MLYEEFLSYLESFFKWLERNNSSPSHIFDSNHGGVGVGGAAWFACD